MFAISSKGCYGLAGMFELALHYSNSHIQIKDIANAQSIPQHYLEQLLVELKKAGLVKSFRGTKGGYSLTKSPAQITIFEILSCLEGPLVINKVQPKPVVLSHFWDKCKDKFKTEMDVTLEDLVNEQQKLNKSFTYSI